jgi:hypothetical protein
MNILYPKYRDVGLFIQDCCKLEKHLTVSAIESAYIGWKFFFNRPEQAEDLLRALPAHGFKDLVEGLKIRQRPV